ncbi:hypothetical protein PBV87_21010 [Niameybacter massiliensis]|uniref:Uncharacterized protein n=1 Tax=Holtiella tumoricola TaxID=3018743 RepID=A0AA42DRG7_9FIRM|nr:MULTISPECIES: hypothetical protein [Lachnospirales]MDA3733958.1 hypothetical protein [Holtiella tumoricola]
MEWINLPIEIISKFNALGEIVPLKLRLEDENHHLQTAKVVNIIYTNENQFAGTKTLDYGCKVQFEASEKMLELRYHIVSHKWTIRRVIC